MTNNYGFGGDEVHEESSWRYLIGIFLATLILSAILLFYYVGPTVDDINGTVPSPTVSEDIVEINLDEHQFKVPANYTVFPRERRGGEVSSLSLYALWPTMTGYGPAWKLEFIDNDPDTRRIDIVVSLRSTSFTELDRIETLYLPHTIDKRGARTPYGLNRHTFRQERDNVPTNGYADTTLFLGQATDNQTMALFCYNEVPTIPSPECWREYELNKDISIIYRYKRPYLAEWREIDERVRQFILDLTK